MIFAQTHRDRFCFSMFATVAVLGLGSARVVDAQSTTWDSLLSNSHWYVPQENLLAYMSNSTSFTTPPPIALWDQTLWSLGTAVEGRPLALDVGGGSGRNRLCGLGGDAASQAGRSLKLAIAGCGLVAALRLRQRRI